MCIFLQIVNFLLQNKIFLLSPYSITDIRSQTSSDKGLVVHISKNEESNGEDSNMKPKYYSRTEDINSNSVKKTTTILIDLSPVSSDNCVTKMELLQKEILKKSDNEKAGKSTGTLQSPSLIMKTINNSSQVQDPGGNNVEYSRQYLSGNKRMIGNSSSGQSEAPVAAPRTKKINTQSQNCRDSKLFIKRACVKTQAEDGRDEETLIVRNQLAALKELYYSAELSDDSERADEEVRSYMSGCGDEDDRDQNEDSSSVVSGSWSRVTAFRNIQHHFHKFNTSYKGI